MNILFPFASIKESIKHTKREYLYLQLHKATIHVVTGRFPNHPSSKIWIYHTHFLCEYALQSLLFMSDNGKHYPNLFDKFHEAQLKVANTGPPSWWGNKDVHSSHQAYLLSLDPDYYSQFEWNVKPAKTIYLPSIDPLTELLRIQKELPC